MGIVNDSVATNTTATPSASSRRERWKIPNSLPPTAMLTMKMENTSPLGTFALGAIASSVGYHRKTVNRVDSN